MLVDKVQETLDEEMIVERMDRRNFSYKEMMVGINVDGVEASDDSREEYDDTHMTILDLQYMKVEDHMDGGYVCPKSIFSEPEERRIHIPWRCGVIVKQLGKRIGYKALEKRLKHMWVKRE